MIILRGRLKSEILRLRFDLVVQRVRQRYDAYRDEKPLRVPVMSTISTFGAEMSEIDHSALSSIV
ncbi:hypothetical protein NVIRENTERO_02344 [Sodalis praecaptivus]|nr:hypothetical protein NVIRENTERO_02344 [Sodalis praecaptivus]